MKADTVSDIVLIKEEHRQSYYGGYIGGKTERMCIKEDCSIWAHKDNMLNFITRSVFKMDQHVFIMVKPKEDDIVWTATTVAYEVVEESGNKRSIINIQWHNGQMFSIAFTRWMD